MFNDEDMNDELDIVELNPAYSWTCDDCGTKNFEEATSPELTREEAEEIAKEYNLPEALGGIFFQVPDTVVCCNCGAIFCTEHRENLDRNGNSLPPFFLT